MLGSERYRHTARDGDPEPTSPLDLQTLLGGSAPHGAATTGVVLGCLRHAHRAAWLFYYPQHGMFATCTFPLCSQSSESANQAHGEMLQHWALGPLVRGIVAPQSSLGDTLLVEPAHQLILRQEDLPGCKLFALVRGEFGTPLKMPWRRSGDVVVAAGIAGIKVGAAGTARTAPGEPMTAPCTCAHQHISEKGQSALAVAVRWWRAALGPGEGTGLTTSGAASASWPHTASPGPFHTPRPLRPGQHGGLLSPRPCVSAVHAPAVPFRSLGEHSVAHVLSSRR